MALSLLICAFMFLCGQIMSDSQVSSTSGWGVGSGPQYSGECENDNYIPTDNKYEASYNQYEPTDCEEIQSSCRCVINNVVDRLELERLHDFNEDEVIDGSEVERALKRVDRNNDGCISAKEMADHDSLKYGWSWDILYDFAKSLARDDNICKGFTITAASRMPAMTLDEDIAYLLQYTIKWCEEDVDRYHTNCDCAQLPDACIKSRLRDFSECSDYINRVRGRHGCIFNSLNDGGEQRLSDEL